MKNEVAVKQDTSVALTTDAENFAWGAEEVESSDIRISRVLLMQPTSEAVGARKAVAGDLIDSLTGEKLGDDKTELNIVPIYTYKEWRIEIMKEGKYEFLKTEAYNAANSGRDREEVIAGAQYRNIITINVLAMLEKDMEDASAMPYLISFRMTGFKAGQDISTVGVKASLANKPLPVFTVKLGCEYVKNEKGQYFIFKVKGTTATKDFAKHAGKLHNWYKTFKSGAAKVAPEDVVNAESEGAELPF